MNASLHSTHTSASSAFSSPLAWPRQVALSFVTHAPSTNPADAQLQIHVLDAGDTIDLAQPLQHELVCLHGRLWITHDHAPVDHIVGRGDRTLAGEDSRMLVHALSDATVQFVQV